MVSCDFLPNTRLSHLLAPSFDPEPSMAIRALLPFVLLLASSASLLAATPAERLVRRPSDWFTSEEGKQTLNHVLAWQTEHGDWPKNVDTTKPVPAGETRPNGTFDNGATVGELRLLAKAFRITQDPRYRDAFLAGFDHILAAQYANGGWPQYYPLNNKYNRYITFNDWSMIRLMILLKDAATENDFAWLDESRRRQASEAVARGIDCIIKCQVVVDGKRTVWCAQHDEVTLAPAKARTFELVSLSGGESEGILTFLMHLEDPSPEVIAAVEAGVAWYEASKITGFHYQKADGERRLTAAPMASPLWARFYEIETNRPIFCGRDGVKKYDVMEIDAERRNGYAWYGNWGEDVADAYRKWPHKN